METKENPGKFDCYEASKPDEPMFVLLARDPIAPFVVRTWARVRDILHGASPKVDEALDCADRMEEWRRSHPEPNPTTVGDIANGANDDGRNADLEQAAVQASTSGFSLPVESIRGLKDR